ncbi:uncharacterized protein LOC118644060 [Monomorium pharaonis]|uniref:uncharacterized protein LOC118644060 n=1 Tax=Monomorium pharaonis TaxID=307658 RepID=UPI00063EE922|nr:uncharacterized protein LOC118644060 [Monomorium pharaonis]
MEDIATIALDSTMRSQNSSHSKESKDSINSELKPESYLESKHSKDVLIPEKQQLQQQHQLSRRAEDQQDRAASEAKDDSNLLMFTSCGQLLLGIVLVVFGILVLVHGASLGGSGAGLWAGAAALVAGALGVVATLAASSTKTNSAFSSAHLASSLIALALSNMATITALTAVVRDSQRTPDVSFLSLSDDDSNVVEVDNGLAGLLASIGLLVASVAELLVSGYSCLTLTPKLCGCLRASNTEEMMIDSHLKTRNMVHQWVVTQNHMPAKSQQPPVYVVHPMPVPIHPMIQPPYGMPSTPGGFISARSLPISTPMPYGAVPMLSHMSPYVGRPQSQMYRSKHKRQPFADQEEAKRHIKNESPKMSSPNDDQVDLAQTYTGLDKRISEEFISIAMDPDRKSKVSSCHGSEIGTAKTF